MKIYWYCPPSVMADFSDPLHNPSFRLRCHHIHTKLLEDGYQSYIVDSPCKIINANIVILMSFGETEYNLAKELSSKGVFFIHDYCENIRGIPVLEATKKLCKFIVCCSTYLKNMEAKTYGDKVVVVKDLIEPTSLKMDFKRKPKRVVWSGMSGNAQPIDNFLKSIIQSNDLEYVEISNREQSTYQWSEYWQYQMVECDIAICPQLEWAFPAKSNVKVTTALSLGLPVICSPLQSYQEVITDSHNGYIAKTLEDWDQAFKKIKNYRPAEWFYLNSKSILASYSLDSIYQQWLQIFKRSME